MNEKIFTLPVSEQISPYISQRQLDELGVVVVSHPKVRAAVALQGAHLPCHSFSPTKSARAPPAPSLRGGEIIDAAHNTAFLLPQRLVTGRRFCCYDCDAFGVNRLYASGAH